MKYLLIFVTLCSINLSIAGGLRRNLGLLAENWEDKTNKAFRFPESSKYPDSLEVNNRENGENRVASQDANLYRQHERPSQDYLYYKSLNLPFQHRPLLVRDVSKAPSLKHRHNMHPSVRRFGSYNVATNELPFNHPTVKSYLPRRDSNSNYAAIRQRDTNVVKAMNNDRISDKINMDEPMPQNNQNEAPGEKGYKSDLTKKKRSSESSNKNVTTSTELFIFGVVMILVPVASIIMVIVTTVATFCWRKAKKTNREGDIEQNPQNTMPNGNNPEPNGKILELNRKGLNPNGKDPKSDEKDLKPNGKVPNPKQSDPMIKTGIVNRNHIKDKEVKKSDLSKKYEMPKKSEPFQEVSRNFVSNDIDGEESTVAKDTKFRHQMTRNLPYEQLPSLARYNNNMFDNGPIEDNLSETESNFEYPIQLRKPIFGIHLPDQAKDLSEEFQPFSERKKERRGRGANKAIRQESNSRNMYSLIHQPRSSKNPATQYVTKYSSDVWH